ncbi:zinc ribbon domain-containing protein [Polynucleobacter paneuropaeus]|nr:zinc ribbon domain-containing protein [Polynucleobacter paneuropaeus]
MNCLSCHKLIKDSAKFCNFCGANQLEIKAKIADELEKKELQSKLEYEAKVKRFKPIALGLIVIAALGFGGYYAFKAAQGEDIARVTEPILDKSSATEKLQTLLKSTNKQYVAADNCYIKSHQTQNGLSYFCEKLVETLEVKDGQDSYIYATLTGIALNDDLSRADYHAASGIIELMKLKDNNGKFSYIDGSGPIFSGSFGYPGYVKIIPLGKITYGWKITDGWMGQGYVYSYLRLYSPINRGRSGIKEILSIQSGFDSSGVCNPGDRGCIVNTIESTVRQDKTSDMYYPLKISVDSKTGSSSFSRDFLLRFDTKAHKFLVPESYNALFK